MAKSSIKRNDKKEGKKTGLHSMNPDRNTDGLKGVAKPRTAGTIKRLQMYRNFKAKRDKRGVVIKSAPFQGYVDSGTRARVEPARGWFSNTKVISQSALQKFQVTQSWHFYTNNVNVIHEGLHGGRGQGSIQGRDEPH